MIIKILKKKKRNIYLIIVLKNNNYHIINRNDIKNKIVKKNRQLDWMKGAR